MTDDVRQGAGREPMTWLNGKMVPRREAEAAGTTPPGRPVQVPIPAVDPDDTDPPGDAEVQVQTPEASTAPGPGGPHPDISIVEQASIATIPEQLHGCRFVKVRRRDKTAFEAGWQTTANYAADDPRILAHLTAGGNYGVMPAGGLCGKPVIGFPIRHYGRRGPRTKTVVRSGGSRPRAAPLIHPSGPGAGGRIT